MLGIRCNNFIMLASEITQTHHENIVILSKDNMFKLSDHLLMAVQGEAGNDNSSHFAESIKRLVQSEKLQRGYELSPSAVANRIYAQLAGAIHNHNERPFQYDSITLAGYSNRPGSEDGPLLLYQMDYAVEFNKEVILMTTPDFVTHGFEYCDPFIRHHYQPDLTMEEAYEIVESCVTEIQYRSKSFSPEFGVKILDKNGVQDLEIQNLSDFEL